jgi:predicted nuclease with TOPRIM domain
MATTKEEHILEFSIEQGDAIKELEKTKKSIIQVKEEQAKLQKEYKKGNVTIEEYAKEQVRLESVLKKQQSTYLNVQKSVTGVKTQLDKLIDSNKNIAKSFDETAKKIGGNNGTGGVNATITQFTQNITQSATQVNVAGTSIGDLTGKLAGFVNPATAAAGVVVALAAAYAKSSTGAKDFAFAQDRLNFIVSKGIEEFGKLVGGGSGEQGSGPLNKLVSAWGTLMQYAPGLNLLFRDQIKAIFEESEVASQAAENLRKLEIATRSAAGAAKFYEKEAEDARRRRDDTDLSLSSRLSAAQSVTGNLQAGGAVRINVLQQEIQAIKDANANWQNQDAILVQIADKRREISDIEEEINGKLTENFTAIKSIQKEYDAYRRKVNNFSTTEGEVDLTGVFDAVPTPDRYAEAIREFEDYADAQIDTMREMTEAQRENDELRKRSSEERRKFQEMQDKMVVDSTLQLFDSIGMLAKEGSDLQKSMALLQIGVDTAEAISALTAASEQNPANGFTFNAAGIAQFIAGLARITANIANAKSYLGFAEGGYTGPGGKFQPAGTVHKGEVVFSQEDVAALGGPHRVDRMRPTYGRRPKSNLYGGYYNGGLVDGAQDVENSLASANAIKRMPAPVVGVVEINKVQERVRVAERVSGR